MSTQRSIPPIPGLPYDRTFSNDADLVDEVADQIVPICAEDDEPTAQQLEKLDEKVLLSKAGIRHVFGIVLRSKFVRTWMKWTAGIKMIADEKGQGLVILANASGTLQVVDIRGREVHDIFGHPLDCSVSNNAVQNKNRIQAGREGMWVVVWITEDMRAWGDFTKHIFGSTAAGRIIKKSYLGIVTEINNQSFEVNILETRGGKGFEGLPEEDRRYYWHIMAEGSQHMMPNALADPGLSTSLDTDDPPETVFVRHRNMRENGILNLRSKKFLYSELVSLAPGWLTEESTVRLEDKLKKCYPLQKTKLIEAAGISQSEADNIRAMPAPGSSNSISGENSGEVAAHTNTGVSNSGNDSWPSDEMPSAPRVCPDFNEGSCKSAGSCPHGLEHLCSDCYREHPRCGGRLPLGVEIKRENEERRNSARGLRPSKSNKRKHSASRAYQDSRLHEARGGGNDQRPDAQRGPHGDLDNNRAQQAAYTRTSNGRSPIRDDRDDRDTQRTAHPQTANGRPFRANESRGRSERRSRSRDRNFEDDFEA